MQKNFTKKLQIKKKILIKLKSKNSENLKIGKNICPICLQKMDVCVTSHKNTLFIDNKLYPKMCFTCYHVPKIMEQKYDNKGYIKEEMDLDYSHENLHTPEELVSFGSADSLGQAKKCVKAIKDLHINKCSKKIKKVRPKLEFYLID